MELKPGYKQTEVGVIPEDWDSKTLGEICEKIQDGNYGGDYPKSYEFINFGVPFLTSKVIGKDGELREHLIDYISEHKHSELKKAHIVLNDVLFTNRGASVGAIGFVDMRIAGSNIGPQLTLLRSLKNLVIPTYLFQIMKSFVVQKQIKNQDSGSAMNFFGVTATKKFIIPLPSTKTEQTAIANALSDADALIQSLTRLIAKKRQIKQGTMQTLFNPYENGRLKDGWGVKKLGDVAPLQRGFDLPNSQLKPGQYPVVYSNGVLNYHGRKRVSGPGVITGRSGTLGAVHYMEMDYWPHNTTLWVTNFFGNDSRFIYYLFKRIGFSRFGTGSGVPTLNRNDAHSFVIGIPKQITEQTRIATVLSDMDAEIAALETKLAKYQHIKQGMMQNLLTGRIRLVKPESNTGAAV